MTNFNKTEDKLPENGVVVETIGPGGCVQDLKREGGLWWVPDGSMYVYYVPVMWRDKEEK